MIKAKTKLQNFILFYIVQSQTSCVVIMTKYFVLLSVLLCFNFVVTTIEAQECGKGRSDFVGTIFGGKVTKKADWPWNVALIHRQAERFFCGGTLISSKHILSGKFATFFNCAGNELIFSVPRKLLIASKIKTFENP